MKFDYVIARIVCTLSNLNMSPRIYSGIHQPSQEGFGWQRDHTLKPVCLAPGPRIKCGVTPC